MLDHAVLSQAQRDQYRRSGWVAVPGLVDAEWIERRPIFAVQQGEER